jgi:hypothetical protein
MIYNKDEIHKKRYWGDLKKMWSKKGEMTVCKKKQEPKKERKRDVWIYEE